MYVLSKKNLGEILQMFLLTEEDMAGQKGLYLMASNYMAFSATHHVSRVRDLHYVLYNSYILYVPSYIHTYMSLCYRTPNYVGIV